MLERVEYLLESLSMEEEMTIVSQEHFDDSSVDIIQDVPTNIPATIAQTHPIDSATIVIHELSTNYATTTV